MVENSRSKANLISAVHEVCDRLNQVVYFPAYECVMDDLRDYRFYASDLIHPSTMAVDYVYSKFKTFAFMEDEVFMDLEKFRVLKNHRVLSKEESEISTHKELLLRKKEGLLVKYPNLELD